MQRVLTGKKQPQDFSRKLIYFSRNIMLPFLYSVSVSTWKSFSEDCVCVFAPLPFWENGVTRLDSVHLASTSTPSLMLWTHSSLEDRICCSDWEEQMLQVKSWWPMLACPILSLPTSWRIPVLWYSVKSLFQTSDSPQPVEVNMLFIFSLIFPSLKCNCY